jgi:hypothetical protein
MQLAAQVAEAGSHSVESSFSPGSGKVIGSP